MAAYRSHKTTGIGAGDWLQIELVRARARRERRPSGISRLRLCTTEADAHLLIYETF